MTIQRGFHVEVMFTMQIASQFDAIFMVEVMFTMRSGDNLV